MTIQAGKYLGPYEILAAIGAGGMGEVYRARDAKLGRDVALKVLPEAFARDAERMARFQREAKVLASLSHPNIAPIYGLEDSSSTHALVMELVEGPTLADRIKQGPIPIDETLRIAKQIAGGLEYAHDRGIVHRDLKPANVKVTNDDAVKVLDFGLAKALESDASSIDISTSPTITRMATMQGVLLGTAAYMSPEQAKAKPVDRRADVWAFGCVLYEMLTGKMAFTGETVTDTLAAVIRAEPDWSQLPQATPARVRVLLQRCLQKDAKQRLRDIGEARISLDEVLSGAPELASGAAAVPLSARVWQRGLPWAVAACFAVAFVAILVAWKFASPKLGPGELMRLEIPVPQTPEDTTRDKVLALSPDGRELAFTATGADGVLRLWVRPLNSLDAHELAGSEVSGSNPPFFWSPDSRYLAFDGGGKLEKIDVSGGPAQLVCDVTDIVVGGSWNKDGVIIFGESPGVIMRVPASGGTATMVTALDLSRGERQQVLPWFLPDGKHFLYHHTSSDPGDDGDYIGSINAEPGKQDVKRLLATQYNAEYVPSSDPNTGQLLYLASGGTLMAQPFDARRLKLVGEPTPIAERVQGFREFGFFSASTDGKLVYTNAGSARTGQITWFDREGKILGTVGKPASYDSLAISPDGSRAAADVIDAQGQIALWMIDFSRRTTTRLTFDSFDSVDPIWSPDGSKIIFTSDRNGAYDIYEKPSDGAGGETLLLQSAANKTACTVSHDGRFLIYESTDPETAKWDLWVLPLDGTKKPYPLQKAQADEGQAQLAPDDRWVAYVSDQSGRTEIYVRPFSPDASVAGDSGGGAKWQVSYGGGQSPLWNRDGKELYYLTPDRKVMEVDVATSPTFQAGTPKLLFQAPQQAAGRSRDYTFDGKEFLFLAPVEQSGQAQSAFNVVLNWQAALKEQQ